jgi:hypothetical protein
MDLLSSPFDSAFKCFLSSLETDGLVCSPYITAGPIESLIAEAKRKGVQDSLPLRVVTDMSARNLVEGSTDPNALLLLMKHLARVSLVHLPKVHAKVYVSGEALAVIGSANLTNGGLFTNFEYGVSITERPVVARIRRDIEEYASLGGVVTQQRLTALAERVEATRDAVREEQRAIGRKLRSLTAELYESTEDELIRARVQGRTLNAIFMDTIAYLLARRPMMTQELHAQIKRIHPDLCDDSKDRVIDGEHFGKLWKHRVRSAQQHLKERGEIVYDVGRRVWRPSG